MRRRKHLIPLTLENLINEIPRDRAYTAEHLAMIFAGSPAAVEEVAETAVARGQLCASLVVRGFRRTFWVPTAAGPHVATRRMQPAESRGDLDYDLMGFARLALAARRG
ncbi:hypothetical protein WT15_27365 [Burkholderia stagnalis]|uniref:hypothetical protein n=1 Tax=Burkholderia stagnalis TaxID=1503054 RepID=UPI000756AEBA|nr:hypothetical protein [Burkholderia stagnalis]KVN72799.1 hypothetical protein WT15_27365 [Burkholderia stagnalis]KWO38179.1 hypothetical protein WT96_12730 [Burkholderia stagnalis]KWO41099.1 hypothetical protein WT95_03115 [Burkholderia stagnalis]